METIMTDYQLDSILGMVDLILQGSSDISDARRKIASLRKTPANEANQDQDTSKESKPVKRRNSTKKT